MQLSLDLGASNIVTVISKHNTTFADEHKLSHERYLILVRTLGTRGAQLVCHGSYNYYYIVYAISHSLLNSALFFKKIFRVLFDPYRKPPITLSAAVQNDTMRYPKNKTPLDPHT